MQQPGQDDEQVEPPPFTYKFGAFEEITAGISSEPLSFENGEDEPDTERNF